MVQNKRYQVFSIKEGQAANGEKTQVWVKAGSAWVNRDGSLNVYLDVLPLDGKLHVREAPEQRREADGNGRTASANGSQAHQAISADSMGGH